MRPQHRHGRQRPVQPRRKPANPSRNRRRQRQRLRPHRAPREPPPHVILQHRVDVRVRGVPPPHVIHQDEAARPGDAHQLRRNPLRHVLVRHRTEQRERHRKVERPVRLRDPLRAALVDPDITRVRPAVSDRARVDVLPRHIPRLRAPLHQHPQVVPRRTPRFERPQLRQRMPAHAAEEASQVPLPLLYHQ